MQVLYVCLEMFSLFKIGGLVDVIGVLFVV